MVSTGAPARKLAIVVIGRQGVGKSSVWNSVTGAVRNRVGAKSLNLCPLTRGPDAMTMSRCQVDMFIIPRSAGDETDDISVLINGHKVRILLVSVRYSQNGLTNIDYLLKNGFDVKAIWLNPGAGEGRYADSLGIANRLLVDGVELSQRDARSRRKQANIAQEIREKILGWTIFNL